MPLLAQGILFVIVAYYAVYVFLETRVLLLPKKEASAVPVKPEAPARPEASFPLPSVSVLLPICNEAAVVTRLIDAACALEYPGDKLEILVLDDSSDATTALAAERVTAHAARGVNIRLLRREDRRGFKAGNLNYGLSRASGSFLALFDADCLPPADFLQRTIPCFQDPQVGFLQTGIVYANKDASFLTRFQALEVGHQQFVTEGLHHEGLMASLSGSSCVWRRECIENIGGISAETITEDVDLGYRAQLRTWKYAYPRDVVSVAELPHNMSAVRVQRERWARGLVQNALRHAPAMLKSPMPLLRKMHAVSMMFSSLLLASFYVVLLLTLPLALMTPRLGWFFHLCCAFFLLLSIIWACGNCIGGVKGACLVKKEPWWKPVLRTYGYVAMFLPMSLYYFLGAIRALMGVKGQFHRTPKGIKKRREAPPPLHRTLFLLEMGSFAYVVAALIYSVALGNGWVLLFCVIACSGFGLTSYFSWQESRQERRAHV